MDTNEKHKYDDIIDFPHHTSAKHPPMPQSDRAAQFSPFAALTGHDAAIRETARLTEKRRELDEYEKQALSEKLQLLSETDIETRITVTFFVSDNKKEGGEYVSLTGNAKRVDEFRRELVMESGERIPIPDIYAIDGEIFGESDF